MLCQTALGAAFIVLMYRGRFRETGILEWTLSYTGSFWMASFAGYTRSEGPLAYHSWNLRTDGTSLDSWTTVLKIQNLGGNGNLCWLDRFRPVQIQY